MIVQFRQKALIAATGVLATQIAVAEIDPFGTGMALADLVRRSLMIDLLDFDPFTRHEPHMTNIDINSPLCTALTIKQGLKDGTCWPSKVTLCGQGCVSLAMEPDVYHASRHQIAADLASPCETVSNLKTPPGWPGTHPSYFFFPKSRLTFLLGCALTPMKVVESKFDNSKLTIRYIGS